MNDTSRWDVVVVGGGMVGAALAAAAGQAGLRVAVLEREPIQRDWPLESVDLRVSALTRASQRMLTQLGAWERIAAGRATPYRSMQVWHAGGGGRLYFDSADIGEPDLGHIVENRLIRLALWEILEGLPNVTRYCPEVLTKIDLTGGHPAVTLTEHGVLEGSLLVGADGRNSRVRQAAAIPAAAWSYHQEAVVCTVTHANSHRDTAWQRFLPDGPLAFLPVGVRQSSIVWSTRPDEAKRLRDLPEAAFARELGEAIEDCLGAIRTVGPRASFALSAQHADSYIRPHLALIGDAAHAIHPLAGQGVNLGLLDAACLAQVLIEAHQTHRPLGSLATLRRFERARRGHNLTVLMAMDWIQQIFGGGTHLGMLPGILLGLADGFGPFKRYAMRQAMALDA